MPVQDRDEKSDKETERPPHEGAAHSAGNAHSGNAAPGNESAPRGAVAPPDGIVEIDERRAKMERLRAEGIDPYPHVSLPDRTLIVDLIAEHELPELAVGPHPELRHRLAGRLISRRGHGKTSFLDLRDLSGSIQIVVRYDTLGEEAYDRIMGLDIGDIISVDGCVYKTQRGQLALEARQCTLLTKTLRPPPDKPPRPRRHGHALPLPRAGPDRQRRDARAVRHARAHRRRDPSVAGRAQLRRGGNAGPAVARRRRRLAPVHHAPQRPGPRPVPAHLRRAVPQPLHRRWAGERLRHGQGVPQRGHLPQAQPGVHDHRVHDGLRGLQRRRHGDRGDVSRRRPAGARTDRHRAWRGDDRPGRAVAADHDARGDARGDRDRLHGRGPRGRHDADAGGASGTRASRRRPGQSWYWPSTRS